MIYYVHYLAGDIPECSMKRYKPDLECFTFAIDLLIGILKTITRSLKNIFYGNIGIYIYVYILHADLTMKMTYTTLSM